MAIEFNYQLPITVDRDKVRFLVGDTNVNRPFLDDHEIAHALTLGGDNVFKSAAYACDAIAARLMRDKSVSVSGITITRNTSASEFKALAVEYRSRSKTLSTKSLWVLKDPTEKTDFEGDTSLIPPSFSIGRDDNKGAAQDSDNFKSASC